MNIKQPVVVALSAGRRVPRPLGPGPSDDPRSSTSATATLPATTPVHANAVGGSGRVAGARDRAQLAWRWWFGARLQQRGYQLLHGKQPALWKMFSLSIRLTTASTGQTSTQYPTPAHIRGKYPM